jgi:hypothetical protein
MVQWLKLWCTVVDPHRIAAGFREPSRAEIKIHRTGLNIVFPTSDNIGQIKLCDVIAEEFSAITIHLRTVEISAKHAMLIRVIPTCIMQVSVKSLLSTFSPT